MDLDNEKLIEIVRKYDFIYNLKHPKYMDHMKKEKAWKEISAQLKHSPVACKQRWQCLRDSFRRALNKRKQKAEQGARFVKKWKYEAEMAFVAPYFTGKAHDAAENPSDDELSSNAEEHHTTESNALDKYNADFDEDIANDNLSNEVHELKESNPLKRKFKSDPSLTALLMAKMIEENKRQDELDRFFLSISETVKKFPPYVQALAKNKIFTLVSEMELQQLSEMEVPAYFNPSPSTSAMPTSPEWKEQKVIKFPYDDAVDKNSQ